MAVTRKGGNVGPATTEQAGVVKLSAPPENPAVPEAVASTDDRLGNGGEGAQGPQGPQGDSGPQGPQGPAGQTGPQGPKGDTGNTGPQGSTGGTGSQGPQGAAGGTGPQGAKGDTGNQGPQGAQGAPGSTGSQGPQGAAGQNGSQGPQGGAGPQGSQGPQGPAGAFNWTYSGKQAADVMLATASFTNTDLVFTFAANQTYIIDLYLLATAAAATTGFRFAFDTSVAVTAVGLHFSHTLANTGTITAGSSIADATAAGLSSGVPTAGALVPILGGGVLVASSTGGTCRLVFGPEVAASATFKAGSAMRVHQVP